MMHDKNERVLGAVIAPPISPTYVCHAIQVAWLQSNAMHPNSM